MVVNRLFCIALFFLLAVPSLGWGQQTGKPAPVHSSATPAVSGGRIRLDVVVTDKAGKPVTGLQAQDFTLLDNKNPQKIVYFKALLSGNFADGMWQGIV